MDSVFEAWRLEALLDESASAEAFGDALAAEGITHLLVNHRYFLRNGNADLRPGRTAILRRRFAAALGAGSLEAVQSWGPVTLYAVSANPDVEPAAGPGSSPGAFSASGSSRKL